MEITTEVVKELRDRTGVSVMQCKKALEEAGGDVAKAEVILKKRAGASADKKSDRELGAGAVASYIHEGTIGSLVLLSCETDFVGRNPEFVALARDVAMQVAANDPKYLSLNDVPAAAMDAAKAVFTPELAGKPEDMKEKIMDGKLKSHFQDQVLLDQPFIKDDSKTVRDLVSEGVQKFGERIEVTRFVRFSAR
ncbi:MAG TPA: elongation factor Ts [Candidatus Paceibacterota bacterium]